MLELELALQPFVERCLDALDEPDLDLYAALLEHDDWDIFDWVQGRAEAPDPALERLIAAIRFANST